MLVALTIRLIPADVFERFRAEAADMWQGGKQKRWRYAIPVAVIWLLIIGITVKSMFF